MSPAKRGKRDDGALVRSLVTILRRLGMEEENSFCETARNAADASSNKIPVKENEETTTSTLQQQRRPPPFLPPPGAPVNGLPVGTFFLEVAAEAVEVAKSMARARFYGRKSKLCAAKIVEDFELVTEDVPPNGSSWATDVSKALDLLGEQKTLGELLGGSRANNGLEQQNIECLRLAAWVYLGLIDNVFRTILPVPGGRSTRKTLLQPPGHYVLAADHSRETNGPTKKCLADR